jgi:hypothetical protein
MSSKINEDSIRKKCLRSKLKNNISGGRESEVKSEKRKN